MMDLSSEDKMNELKEYLLDRLDQIWDESMTTLAHFDRVRLYGNANELGLMLIYVFGVSGQELDLIKEKVRQRVIFRRAKYGGYCLTKDNDGNHITIKDGKVVDPKFWLMDNGIGDERAVEAEKEYRAWLEENGVTDKYAGLSRD